ncbi:MAG: hypothetical protein OXU42_03995 [Deltaproteobacteria bacterium]|nr:hypothetical protein [Deltaproteobacteria bacterium]
MKYTRTGKTGNEKYRVTEKGRYVLLGCMNSVDQTFMVKRNNGKVLAKMHKGHLTVYPDYAWDGVTYGPDVPCAMEASLVHDALYQIIREKMRLPKESEARLMECADRHLYCWVKDNCSSWLASTMYNAVRGYQTAGFIGGALGLIWGAIRGIFMQEFACA